MKHKPLLRPCLMLLAMLIALPTLAQPLVDQVPSEAALYVGWRGATDMGPDYEGSNMQGVINQTGLLEALPKLIDSIRAASEEGVGEQEAELISMGGTLWTSMWDNGGAMYMLPPQEGGPPIPRVAMLWKKGEDDAKLRESLSKLVGMINDAEEVPAFMGTKGDAIFMSIGFDAAEALAGSLSNSARFKDAAKQIQVDGALVVYVDAQEWISQVDQFAEMMKEQAAEFDDTDEFAELWPKLRDASGLSGVRRLMLSAGIKEKNWHTQVFLDAPAPRSGVLSLVDNKPIQPANLSHVPKTATFLQVFTMDTARVLDVTRDMLSTVDPSLADEMDEGLKEASELVGFNLERELIKGMGPVWSVYIDPMIAGNGFSSMVFVNELRDAPAVEEALMKLTTSANELAEEEVDEGPIKVRFLTREIKGTKVTHLGIPVIAPSWMVHKGRLYVSLFPQALEMAIEQSGKREDSILANQAFNQAMDRFAVQWERPKFTGLSFTDLPETAPDGYGINLMIMQAIAGFGEMMDGKASTLRMPPIGKVMPFIEPAGSVIWVDDAGLHMHAIEPFPGSSLLGPAKGLESTMAVSAPLAVGVMLPALGSARAAARDAQAMSNARQLAVAAMSYAADHDGQFPQDIALLSDYVWGPDVWIAPNSKRAQQPPFNFDDWEDERQHKFIRKNSSYILVPVANMDELRRPNETIVFFQRTDDAPGLDKFAVTFADGHVEMFGNRAQMKQQLKKQTDKTVEELIKRQENFGQ